MALTKLFIDNETNEIEIQVNEVGLRDEKDLVSFKLVISKMRPLLLLDATAVTI